MGRKKSRKVGLIGIRKTDAPRFVKENRKPKSKKGNKAGSRQHQSDETKKKPIKTLPSDPRLGSKAPIDLNRYKNKQSNLSSMKKVTLKKSPMAELEFIESDQKLQILLDKMETKKLLPAERIYVDERLERHRILCELLGLNNEEEETIDDPLSELDAINMKDFKD